MKKKSGRTIRSKRRPSTKRESRREATTVRLKGVAAKGEAGTFAPKVSIPLRETKIFSTTNLGPVAATEIFGDSFDVAGQQIAASQHKPNAAVQLTQDVIEPPPAALGLSTSPPDVIYPPTVTVHPPVSPIAPTIYPESPRGTIIVQNHVTINIQTDEFARFNKNLEGLIGELRQSNEISGEVRDKLVSELRSGKELITGPKPQRDLIDLLLVRPLKWLAEKSGSAIIQKLALDALAWLLRML